MARRCRLSCQELSEYRDAIRLHDFASGEVIALLTGHTGNILSLAFSPSGRWLASAGKDKTIRIWDMTKLGGNKIRIPPLVLTGHTDRVLEVAWSPKGDRLASASYDGTIGLWDTEQIEKGKVTRLKNLKKHSGKVRSVAFHPDGTDFSFGW